MSTGRKNTNRCSVLVHRSSTAVCVFFTLRVDLDEECVFKVYFRIFTKFRYFSVFSYRKIPNFWENTAKN